MIRRWRFERQVAVNRLTTMERLTCTSGEG